MQSNICILYEPSIYAVKYVQTVWTINLFNQICANCMKNHSIQNRACDHCINHQCIQSSMCILYENVICKRCKNLHFCRENKKDFWIYHHLADLFSHKTFKLLKKIEMMTQCPPQQIFISIHFLRTAVLFI